MSQRDTRRYQEETPISEPNYNQDTVQKDEIPQILHHIYQKEELIKWLIKQLTDAKRICDQFTHQDFDIETHLNQLKKIIDSSLEKANQQHDHSVDAFELMDEDSSQQGTPSIPQALLTEQAAEMCSKEVNEPSRKYSKQLLVREEDLEQRKGSEQFRQVGYNQERKFHQQQQQIQMSASDEQQQPINNLENIEIYRQHEQLKQKYQLTVQKKMDQSGNIQQQLADLKNDQKNLKTQIKTIFEKEKDQLQNFIGQIFERENQICKSWQKKCMDLSDKLSAALQQGQSDNSLQKQVKKLDKQNNELTAKIQSLEQQINTKKQNCIDLQQKLDKKDTKISELSEYITVIEKSFKEEKEILENQISQLQKEIQMNQLKDPQISQILAEQAQRQNQILQTQQNTGAQLEQFPTLNEKLDYIKRAINGDYLRKIKELEDQNQQILNQNELLKQEVNQLKLNIQKNDQMAILNEKNQELKQKDKQILEQTLKLNQQSCEMENFKKKLSEIDEFIQIQHTNRKMKFEEEYESILATHLDGCYKLQEKSILFIFVGLKIYKQYLNSESREVKNVEKALENLTKHHNAFEKKDNFKLKDKRSLEKYYNDCLNELNTLYDQTLQSYKILLNELKQRNN